MHGYKWPINCTRTGNQPGMAGVAVDAYEDSEILVPRLGRSDALCCLSSSSSIRRGVHRMVYNRCSEGILLMIIMLNTISMILVAPPSEDWKLFGEDGPDLKTFLQPIDTGFTAVFIMECILKVIALGFVMHEHSYLRDAWNRLDFLVRTDIIGHARINM